MSNKVHYPVDGIIHPIFTESHTSLVHKNDADKVEKDLCVHLEEIVITKEQGQGLFQWAGGQRCFIEARKHGVRVMAWLAEKGLLDPGEDPVETLEDMLELFLE